MTLIKNFISWVKRKIDGLEELSYRGFEFKHVGLDGLTNQERIAVDFIARKLGYNSLRELSLENGYSSAREMAYSNSFKCVRDFFLGGDWYSRLKDYDKRNINFASFDFQSTSNNKIKV